LVKNNLQWTSTDYTNEQIDDETTPSTKLVKMFIMLANLRTLVGQLVNQRIVLPILTSIIEEIALRMDESKKIEKKKKNSQGI
jgi:hypothetical protein